MLKNSCLWRKTSGYLFYSLFILAVACKDDDDPAPVINAQDFVSTIDEIPQAGALLGKIGASSNKGVMSFLIKTENPSGAFKLEELTGELSVLDPTKFDFAVNSIVTAIVEVKNGTAKKDVNVKVNLRKVNPVITAVDLNITINENQKTGVSLGKVQASSDKGTMTFSIKSESVPGAFAISEETGDLTIADHTKFDYEVNPLLTAVIEIKNGESTKEVNVRVQLEKEVWTGPEITFTKAHNANWTLAVNQDKISEKVIITRQTAGPIYNYHFWMDQFSADATVSDLRADFWNSSDSDREFTASGGTTGVRWAILDDTGADNTEAWASFNLYGKLGDPTNFFSFHNVASIITALNDNGQVTGVIDNFSIEISNGADQRSGTVMPELIGKKLGVWLVEEDVYLTLTFTHWGADGGDNGVSYKRSTKN